MDHLPIFLDVKGQRALVVGGGTLAARKADLLARAGADLTVLTPDMNDDLARVVAEFEINHKQGDLSADDVSGCVIVFGASADNAINLKVHELATAAGIMVNISDTTDLCDFIMPAIVDRSPLLISISSGGATPLLTRMLKARFETTIPAAYGRLAEFAGSYRDRVKESITNMARRRRFWETMID